MHTTCFYGRGQVLFLSQSYQSHVSDFPRSPNRCTRSLRLEFEACLLALNPTGSNEFLWGAQAQQSHESLGFVWCRGSRWHRPVASASPSVSFVSHKLCRVWCRTWVADRRFVGCVSATWCAWCDGCPLSRLKLKPASIDLWTGVRLVLGILDNSGSNTYDWSNKVRNPVN